jgi:hypothetical protein
MPQFITMKKTLLTLITLTTLNFAACKKDEDGLPDGSSATYQPFSAGSIWKYRNTSASLNETPVISTDTTVNSMTADTKKIENTIYHLLKSKTGEDNEEVYFSFNNHIYSTYENNDLTGFAMNLPYLNDQLEVNGTWITPLMIDEPGDAIIEAQVKGTIVEKNITKNVLGKNYTNVIHSKMELQYKEAGQYQTGVTFDFYIAKGVGIVAIYVKLLDNEVSKSELFDYTIK